ncbi:hypothetical protein ACFOZY_03545 [Chungangia koreensis]|uniref:Uncharacterized protein n=1 Tax=Chungangia koreensis TaxID=752657 RepID=A0ABV8X3A3_9LACT
MSCDNARMTDILSALFETNLQVFDMKLQVFDTNLQVFDKNLQVNFNEQRTADKI